MWLEGFQRNESARCYCSSEGKTTSPPSPWCWSTVPKKREKGGRKRCGSIRRWETVTRTTGWNKNKEAFIKSCVKAEQKWFHCRLHGAALIYRRCSSSQPAGTNSRCHRRWNTLNTLRRSFVLLSTFRIIIPLSPSIITAQRWHRGDGFISLYIKSSRTTFYINNSAAVF